ncbi:MAG: caspase family protein [Azoarcus sp.]|nr:caspase family protein [Azoarcus sp.]
MPPESVNFPGPRSGVAPDATRRRLLRCLCGGGLALLCQPAPTAHPKRLGSALLIGNERYAAAPLQNPANDARAMQAALERIGFTTRIEIDADYANMLGLLREYLRRAEDSDVRLIFFAGHGVQWQGRNYLIPVDAAIRNETELLARGVDLGMIVDRLAALREGVNVVIVDACRNNPFLPSVSGLADVRRLRMRGSKGNALSANALSANALAANGLAPENAPNGTLVAFSTSPGAVSVDNPEGENSIYTALLVERLATPGLPVERLFKEVRAEVARRTGQRQVPWENSSLTGEFCFRPDAEGRCG